MPIRMMEGQVVSNKADKTVSVLVERKVMHPIYKKYMRRSKKYLAHDEGNTCQEGDIVVIKEIPPMSKRKCWMVAEKKEAK